MTHDMIYLGSQSQSRQQLLKEAGISFEVIEHTSDEEKVDRLLGFHDYVLTIARGKSDALELPSRDYAGKDYLFVVTADTLDRSVHDNKLYGKPVSKEHAIEMIKQISKGPVEIATGCCLRKYVYENNSWVLIDTKEWVTASICEFIIPDDDIEQYLKKEPGAMYASGGSIIEGFGGQFLKSLNGSYSAVMGLPLFELRQALRSMNFQF